MPAEVAGGRAGEQLAFIPVGKTVGFGSFHFSQDTMRVLEIVLARQMLGRPVNSIFGEGVNPKLRKVRGALDVLGLPSNLLLQHGSPRIIYAVPLARNFRDVLIGRAKRATPLIPDRPGTSPRIVQFWRERWLANRIDNSAVLEAVATHTLAYPVRHGARVALPLISGEEGPLFAELAATTTGETGSIAIKPPAGADRLARAVVAASPG